MNNMNSSVLFNGILADVSDVVISDTIMSDTVASDIVASDVVTSDIVASDAVASDIVASDAAPSDVVMSETVASDSVPSGLAFHPKEFISSSAYMGKGMIAIFVTIGIIVLVTAILNRIKTKE